MPASIQSTTAATSHGEAKGAALADDTAPPQFVQALHQRILASFAGLDAGTGQLKDQALAILPETTGTEWLALIVTCYQENVASTEITCDLPRTPTGDDLQHALETVEQARGHVLTARGIVMKKNHRSVWRPAPDQPHPFVRGRHLAVFLEDLDPCFIGL